MNHYVPHPHIEFRKKAGAVKVRDQLPTGHPNRLIRFNAKVALVCTVGVGSMWCAYAFAILAVAGLPTALKPGNIGFLFWVSSDLLQLTLLSVIIVGQNIQALAADKRAEQTFLDVEALLQEVAALRTLITRQSAQTSQTFGESDDDHFAVRGVRGAEPDGADRDPDPHGKVGAPPESEGYGAGPRPVA
jgi:hypothetical protein